MTMTPFDAPSQDNDADDELFDDSPLNEDEIEIIDLNPDESAMDDDAESEESDDETEDAALIFTKHNGSVFSCAFDNQGQLAVTGGEDNRAFIWNTNTGEVVLETEEGAHSDSVDNVAFNSNNLVATGDMAGTIHVWNLSSGNPSKMATFDLGSDLTWMSWHPVVNGLMAGTQAGVGWWLGVRSGEMRPQFPGHGPPITCGCIFEEGKKAALGYEDGIIKIWDLKSLELLFTLGGLEHGEKLAAVLNLSCSPDGKLLLAGYREDGAARLFNTKNGKTLAVWEDPTPTQDDDVPNPVEALAFNSNNQFAAIGRLSGLIQVYDLASKNVRINIQMEENLTKLLWDSPNHLLYAATTEGNLKAYDSRNGEEVRVFHGNKNGPILDACLSSDGEKILTAGDDGKCRIFKTK